ncbi:MAG: glycosyltransferase family 4 protein [Candidatus Margulisiibacteriota bacterium]
MKKINIILDHNYYYNTSISRVAAMYGNQLSKNGYEVTISYPVLSWYRYYLLFLWQKHALLKYLLFNAKFLLRDLYKLVLMKERGYALSKDVRLNRYWYKPTKQNIPDADYIIIFQGQLLFDLVALPKNKGIIIDSLHTGNYSGDTGMGKWFNYLLETVYLRVNVKRFAVSSTVSDFYKKSGVRVDKVINNGVDIDEFKPSSLSDKKVGYLMFSDAKKAKGYDFGVGVIKHLKAQGVKEKFYSIGRHIKGLDTSIFDEVYGALNGARYAEALRKHLFFLYPSLYDGFPAPPLEAMASGAVCIIANVAGVNEYAVDGENCMLCEPGNLNDFVIKINRLLSNTKLRENISKNAVLTARRYSWEICAKNIMELMNT